MESARYSSNDSPTDDSRDLEGPRDYTLSEEDHYDPKDYMCPRKNLQLPPGRFAAWILLGGTVAILIALSFLKNITPSLRYTLCAISLGAGIYLLFSRRNNDTQDSGDGAVV